MEFEFFQRISKLFKLFNLFKWKRNLMGGNYKNFIFVAVNKFSIVDKIDYEP